MPTGQTEKELDKLHKIIIDKVTADGFNSNYDATCLFPPDLRRHGPNDKIIIEVDEFSDLGQTPEARQRLAELLGTTVYRHCKNTQVICFVDNFNPAGGFHNSSVPSC